MSEYPIIKYASNCRFTYPFGIMEIGDTCKAITAEQGLKLNNALNPVVRRHKHKFTVKADNEGNVVVTRIE